MACAYCACLQPPVLEWDIRLVRVDGPDTADLSCNSFTEGIHSAFRKLGSRERLRNDGVRTQPLNWEPERRAGAVP